MPKFNADEKIYEPIEVILNGKTYTVEKVDQGLFDKIKEVSKDKDEGASVIYKQLAIVLSVEASEFEGTDLRKATAILRFLTDTITAQVEGKNA